MRGAIHPLPHTSLMSGGAVKPASAFRIFMRGPLRKRPFRDLGCNGRIMDLRETGCEDGRWMELAQDRVQWQALVLAVLNLRVMLPPS
jgi:hypothetical protein